jgi:hypothetical protein
MPGSGVAQEPQISPLCSIDPVMNYQLTADELRADSLLRCGLTVRLK